MADKTDIQEILQEFMKNATPGEISELKDLLEQRNSPLGARINVHAFASKVAEQIRKDIGYSSRNIKNTARRLVIDLARQYNPDISEKELNEVLREMVPEETPLHKKIPKEIMAAMVDHFISFADDTMSPETAKGFPPGWQKKYWNAFSPAVQKAVAAYVRQDITRDELFAAVVSAR